MLSFMSILNAASYFNQTANSGEWLQVDFLQSLEVFGVVTQGRHDSPEWPTTYTIQFGNSTTSLQTLRQNGRNLVN